MSNVRHIIDSLGRDTIRERLGVSTQSISDAIREDRFPARWYAEIAAMGSDAGLEIPLALFAFIGTPRQRSVSAPSAVGVGEGAS